MNILVIVLARDKKNLIEKIDELEKLGYNFLIICGEKTDTPNTLYRKPVGKYDAINYSITKIPGNVDTIIYNDIDTKISGIEKAIKLYDDKKASLVYIKLKVIFGPQVILNRLVDSIKRLIKITASGELIIVRKKDLEEIMPIKPCKAEDTYILFKFLELRKKVFFYEEAYVITDRTQLDEKEELYKRKTVTGIYQALSFTNPPIQIKLFYKILPFFSPILLVMGKKGYYTMRGIILGYIDYLRGDVEGSWKTDYMSA